jgi:hypothetical protein
MLASAMRVCARCAAPCGQCHCGCDESVSVTHAPFQVWLGTGGIIDSVLWFSLHAGAYFTYLLLMFCTSLSMSGLFRFIGAVAATPVHAQVGGCQLAVGYVELRCCIL